MRAEEPSDDYLENCVGRWGWWQFYIIFAIFLSKLPIAFHQVNIIIITAPVNVTCKNNADLCSSECDEFIHDKSVMEETIETEFGLFCSKKSLKSIAQVATMVGILIGNFLFGIIADKYGRKWPLITAIMISAITGSASAFSPWYWMFIMFRIICSICTGGTMNTSFVMIAEIVGKKYRSLLGIIYQIPYSIGYAILGLIGYYQRDWKWFIFYQSICPSILILYCFIIPEAPRWLMAVGNKEKAIKILEFGAKFNKRPVENVRPLVEAAYKPSSETVKKDAGNISLLFKTRTMLIRTMCMSYNWFMCGFSFYGVSQYLNKLSGNLFLNVALAGLVQIPGICLTVWFIDIFGRKKTLIWSNIAAAVSILVVGFVHYPDWLEITLASIAVSTFMMSFSNLYVFGGELFPTTLRNSGIGFCSVCARIGAIISPFIDDLSEFGFWLPCVIFAITPLIGAFLCIFLPETKDVQLADTIEEAQRIGE